MAGNGRKRPVSGGRGSDMTAKPTARTDRIHKILSASGVHSRRAIEHMIRAGRIRVNGRVATLGQMISSRDRVNIDGKPVRLDRMAAPRRRIVLFNKPEGVVTTTHDPEGRPTVFASLPKITHARWVAVGRLDINTQGLLVLTTDGRLAHRLMHPSFAVEREYAVRILGALSPTQQRMLIDGVALEDGVAKVERLTEQGGEGENRWYNMIIKEGRNREVRRLVESQGVRVSRLIRLRFGPLSLPRDLWRGHWRELDHHAVNDVALALGLETTSPPRSITSQRATRQGKVRRRTAVTGRRRG